MLQRSQTCLWAISGCSNSYIKCIPSLFDCFLLTLGESCSHIGAILFKIEPAVRLGDNKQVSTDVACKWSNDFVKKIEGKEIGDAIFYKTKTCIEKTCFGYFRKWTTATFVLKKNETNSCEKATSCSKFIQGLFRTICIYKTCPIKSKDTKLFTGVLQTKHWEHTKNHGYQANWRTSWFHWKCHQQQSNFLLWKDMRICCVICKKL